MLTFGLICALVATVSAGYASSSSGGAGLYNSNNYDGGEQYSSKYPYSNQYSGYASTGGAAGGAGAFPFVPFPAIPSPFQFNNAFQQYYNSLNAFNAKQATMTLATEGAAVSAMASLSLGPTKYRNKKISNLYNQQLAHQANVFSQIQNQALGGGAGYAGAGGFGGGAAYGGAGAGGFGGSVGSFGSTGGNGQAYGGTYGGGYPSYNQGGGGGGGSGANYASSGGAVGYGGQQQLQASIYPSNQYSPNLDSRFGDDAGRPGVTHSQGAPGFSGVSSFSSSSDINGVKNRESATSVNNNGKVTTYHVRS